MDTLCHSQRSASGQLSFSPELNEVLTEVVSVVNFIKTRPLKARLFSALCEAMGADHSADHSAVLFHSEAKVAFPRQCLEIQIFLGEERMYEAAVMNNV